MIRFRGHVFSPLVTGALYWPAQNALIVADLHLEKLSAYARSGQLLPPYDTGLTLARLERDLNTTGADQVIALGDSFHRDEGTATLLPHDRARLEALTARARWIWIAGNHDPSRHTLGGHCCDRFVFEDCTFTHHPTARSAGHIAGHLHPAARIAMNGRSTRRSCFVWDDRQMILPAYGVSTGSLNILSPAFAGLFAPAAMQVTMLGRDRLYPVSPKRLVHG